MIDRSLSIFLMGNLLKVERMGHRTKYKVLGLGKTVCCGLRVAPRLNTLHCCYRKFNGVKVTGCELRVTPRLNTMGHLTPME